MPMFAVLRRCTECIISKLFGKVIERNTGWLKKEAYFGNGVSACDSFLWGYPKSKVYVRKPRTVDDLKVSVREETATVPQVMLVNVMQNFEERLTTAVTTEEGWRTQPTQHHTVTRGCMCSRGKLLMMDTMKPLVTVWCSVGCVLQPCSIVTAVTKIGRASWRARVWIFV
jgi:hypothetical protein